MYSKAIEILSILDLHGFEAYIVGGYVRDTLLDKKSLDIDICTSASPKDIMNIFDVFQGSWSKYGAVKIIYKKSIFDLTTFRKDMKYTNNRKPVKLKYIKNLKDDLLRRDFTINTFCIDKNGKVLDLLDVKDDLDNKLIRSVGNARYKFKQDSLRILRAVRFATILGFNIEDNTKKYLIKYGYLLKNLSYQRKKEEINKIFTNSNKEKGRELILSLKLDKYLELGNLNDIVLCDDILGIWCQINNNNYPFSNYEKKQMDKINKILLMDIDDYVIYKYEPYLCFIATQIKGINIDVMDRYDKLVIHSKSDIVITFSEIANILTDKSLKEISDIMNDLEKKIVLRELDNNKDSILKYILNYK